MIHLFFCGTVFVIYRLLVLHLAVVNRGSRSVDQALRINDVTLSQAFYAQLEAGATDYYRFAAAPDTTLRLTMLVPQRLHASGFAVVVTLHGPDLPAEGLVLSSGDEGMRVGTTTYQRTQRLETTIAKGDYQVAVQAQGTGVYCLCVGTREPDEHADPVTKAHVRELLEGV